MMCGWHLGYIAQAYFDDVWQIVVTLDDGWSGCCCMILASVIVWSTGGEETVAGPAYCISRRYT